MEKDKDWILARDKAVAEATTYLSNSKETVALFVP